MLSCFYGSVFFCLFFGAHPFFLYVFNPLLQMQTVARSCQVRPSCIANALAGETERLHYMQKRFGGLADDRKKPRRVKLVAVSYGYRARRDGWKLYRFGVIAIAQRGAETAQLVGILAGKSDRKARKRDPYQLIE